MESKNIKDYLHLYMGCHAQLTRFIPHATINDKVTPSTLTMIETGTVEVKLFLRPLSDMTGEEINKICFNYCDAQSHIEISTDLYGGKYKFNPMLTVNLFKMGFDIFGLIPAGLAIDKTKI